MSRRFSRKQRLALFAAADGKCELCGKELSSGWHADHSIPWSMSGETDVINGQALCPDCNFMKGNTVMVTFEMLRPWQKRFVTKFRGWLEQNFLLVALPAGGKTWAALFAAKNWLENPGWKNRYLVVVVPTRNLRRQWFKKAKKDFGLEFQTKEFDGCLKSGMHGIVTTYSAVSSDPEAFRRLCAKHDVMVIFDEMHHAGDEGSWGPSIKQAFEPAARRLSMSGTPWRSDGGRIPFLDVDEETGEYRYDEVFDWPLALEETPQAVRHLAFMPYHGFTEHESNGEVFKLSTHEEMSDDDTARCLRGLVMEMLFAVDMMRDAHQKLIEVKQTKPDAAGLVVCMDIPHAERTAKRLQEITGEKVWLIVSDEDISNGDSVETFEDQRGNWVVSVRQVSEGVDIPRLMVGVYLTNYATELFFRQFVGRFARHQQTEADREAYVYFPADRRLIEFAEKIKMLQALAIQNKQKKEKEEPGEGEGPGPSSIIYLGGSNAEAGGIIVPGVATYSVATHKEISEFARKYGITETAAALILRDQKPQQQEQEQEPPEDLFGDDRPLEERLDDMRRRQHKRIGYWARLSGLPYNDLNVEANRHASCEAVDTATESQLKRRRSYIERKIEEYLNATRS